ncbi:extracellular solute-binding protein [Cryobacterium sp. Hh11]|uniref:ABC transporter substrate-binding protein n=1 Tax=Cryobacterium sp. Hh11 TaxID=2555868 RepID=UPI00106BE80D|nr:extracellular solute-binding protein [Cryobacterium sp. Hh11]TFD54250.1 extracellular solute-binding protein [Cryobacterium sp. Hh11]
MKKAITVGVGLLAVTGLLAGCSGATAEPGSPITLTFQSLAWQETTIAATETIVADWNAANPNVQVNITQGSWDNVQDQLVTQFQGGTAPDIIHYESAAIAGFAEQGYLADLSPYLGEDLKRGITDDIWKTVTASDGSIVGLPTLLQSYVVFANADAFAAAGVELPTGDELSWDDLAAVSSELTVDGGYGLGWGLKSPTATVMNMGLGFDGTYFATADGVSTISVGDAELEVPERIHAMAYDDKSIEPVSLTLSGTDALPGFFGGDYAMFFGGNFYSQQMTESAPEGFNWVVLPPLAGSAGTAQAANPQTLSVAAESDHIEEAAAFLEFFAGAENLSALGQGDWLVPTSADGRAALLSATGGDGGWTEILKSGETLAMAPFQSAVGYVQWKDQIATPALQQYFANAITTEELRAQLQDGFAGIG